MAEYIYLIKEREFIRTNDDILKIGKTKQQNSERIKSYPKGSVLLIQMKCLNCDTAEKTLISKFKSKYKHRSDIGAEYFEGDTEHMIKDIVDLLLPEHSKPKVQPVKSATKDIEISKPRVEIVKPININEFLAAHSSTFDNEFIAFCSRISEEQELLSVYREKATNQNEEDYNKKYPNTMKLVTNTAIWRFSQTKDNKPVVIIKDHIKNKNEVFDSLVRSGIMNIIILE